MFPNTVPLSLTITVLQTTSPTTWRGRVYGSRCLVAPKRKVWSG